MDPQLEPTEHHSPKKEHIHTEPVHTALPFGEAWARDLVRHSNDLMCIHDLQGRLLFVNQSPGRVLGYSAEELLQTPMRDLLPPEHREQFEAYLKAIAMNGEFHGQMVVITRTGQRRIWEFHNTLRSEGLVAPVVRGIALDITERKQMERSLLEIRVRERAMMKELQTVLDAVPAPIYVAHDVECRRITANRAGNQQLRIESGANASKSGPEPERPRFRVFRDGTEVSAEELPMQLAASTGSPIYGVPLSLLFEDGVERHAVFNAMPLLGEDGKPTGAIGSSLDITATKRVEDELRRSEESYRMFVARASEGIFREDLDAPIQIDLPEDEMVNRILNDSYLAECNDSMAIMYGLTSGKELIGKRLTAMVVADDPRNIELTREYIRSGFRVLERESHEVDMHGNPKIFLNSMIGIVENGMLIRTWGIQRDITEKRKLEEAREQAEESLRQSDERLRIALENSPLELFHQDLNLRYTWAYNLQGELTAEDYLGKTDEDLFEEEDAARISAIKRRVLESGRREREEITVAAHGRSRYCDLVVEPLLDAEGQVTGVNCAVGDVTYLHKITEELRLAKERLSEEKLYLEQTIDTELGFGEIIGKSEALRAVMEQLAKVAVSDSSVLLLGETGTGKELLARAVHNMSKRRDKSFIKMNCAAIPSGLLESELFGHEKGAFTGAVARKIGRLELADRGTLFLDEIGEIALELQPKLLRVLQDQEFERLGSTQTLKVNFRLVAATNRDLLRSVRERQYRSDLYYRLNVFPIHIPPLRERREDIQPLVEHFLRKYSGKMNKSVSSIPRKTMAGLIHWDWPGNVRELENFIERSVILSTGSVLQAPMSELERPIRPPDDSVTTKDEHERGRERKKILHALQQGQGRLSGRNGAAVRLGMKLPALQLRLKQLNIDPAHYRQ